MKVGFSVWKALSIASYTVSFLSKALEDGKISIDEILDYLKGLIKVLGVNIEIKVPDQVEGGQG